MTQEEKQLLLKDLSARLPYGVKVHITNEWFYDKIEPYDRRLDCDVIKSIRENRYTVKPYLRPMSSMTDEELKELNEKYGNIAYFFIQEPPYYYGLQAQHSDIGSIEISEFSEIYDWLLEHHFDFRGLIEKGLALEALPGMYDKEESEEESEVPIPKTVDEAVKTLAKILSDEDREYLLKNGAISMHNSLGRWIRNEWGLWTGSELKDELMNMNKGLNHPDDMSNYIIEEFIKYWNNKL